MAYYIKTIGIRGKPIGISEERFKKMLSSQMCFKKTKRKISRRVTGVRKGDKFVIYCIRNGVREFLQGGFIGSQLVLSSVYEDRESFGPPWIYIVNIKPQIRVEPTQEIALSEVRNWAHKSEKLKNALNVNLLAIGGLLEIEESDYMRFREKFEARNNFGF